MTRIDHSDIGSRCWRSDHNQARLINAAREAAHAKHGDSSIEALSGADVAVGEVAHALTYDAVGERPQNLANELLDVMAVAAAWLDALRVEGVHPTATKTVWLA